MSNGGRRTRVRNVGRYLEASCSCHCTEKVRKSAEGKQAEERGGKSRGKERNALLANVLCLVCECGLPVLEFLLPPFEVLKASGVVTSGEVLRLEVDFV